MSYKKEHKTFEEQIEIFKERGMYINNKEKAVKRLEHISYYKIKEFSKIYFKNDRYEKISIEEVIKRFYTDKNIRMYLLHAIEKVELSFKTKFSYLLGKKYGAFGYLNFSNWCNKKGNVEAVREKLELEEKSLKTKLKEMIKKGDNSILKDFFRDNKGEEFPPVWIFMEILTFGEVLHLFNLMSRKNKEIVASHFNTDVQTLYSWMKNLKIVRNFCAHNANVIDLKIKTPPVLKDEWKEHLYYNVHNVYTDRIARSLVILKEITQQINPEYKLGYLYKAMESLIRNSDAAARRYGFYNLESFHIIMNQK